MINNKRDYVLAESISTTPRLYLVKAGKRIDVTSPEQTEILLNAMNDKCQLVGHVAMDMGYRAVLWNDGQWLDLNILIPKNTGWVLGEAQGINEKGQIVGSGTQNGVTCAFLLTPIS